MFSGINVASAASDEQNIEALIENFNEQDVDVKADSVKALVEAGKPAVGPLIQALDSKDLEIRENAAITLGKIKDERAIDPLIKLLTDEEWEVESAATNALVEIGEPAAEPLIKILQDENEDVFLQMKVIAVLAGIKDERAIQPMIQALKEEPELDADLGYNLGLMGESAVEPLIQALNDEDSRVRVRAAEALGRLGDKRAIDPLTDALNDKDETVRTFAKIGLKSIEAQKKNTFIATYGREREFYIEDQRREWLSKLDTVYKLSGNSMEPYTYPQGPVISYGWSIENRIGVGILEGSEVNNSTLDDIYNIFDQAGKEIGVADVPVIFSYAEFGHDDLGVEQETAEKTAEKTEENEKINELMGSEEINGTKKANETEESAEDLQLPVSIPGLGVMFVFSALVISALIVNRR
ncbi:putative lyase [Methanosarcina barkeri str. Wiesmoor]|nr:putative lyase [Methanosarcina barkeri str. Wiesmoor]